MKEYRQYIKTIILLVFTNHFWEKTFLDLLPKNIKKYITDFLNKKDFYNIEQKLSESEYEAFVNSIHLSTNRTRWLLSSYVFFLIFLLVTATSITSESLFLNTNIKFFTFDIPISISVFITWAPVLTILLHIFIVESLLLHHYKVMSFMYYQNDKEDVDYNSLFVSPFAFNHTSLYFNNKKTSISFLIFFNILLALPIVTLFILYYSNTYSLLIFFSIIFISLLNIYFSISLKSKNILYIPSYLMFIVFFIMLSIKLFIPEAINEIKSIFNIEVQKKVKNDEKYNYINYSKIVIDQDLTPISEQVKLHKIDKSKDEIYSGFADGIHMNGRELSRFEFIYSKFGNTVAYNTDFKKFKYDSSQIINNRFYNSNFENHKFMNTQIVNSKFEGILLDQVSIFGNRFRTKISNWFLTRNSIVKNSEFKRVDFNNIEFNNTDIFDTRFDSNRYENFVIQSSEILNSSFIGGSFGIKDQELEERLEKLVQMPYYKKYMNDSKVSEADKREYSQYVKELRKEKIFSNVCFKNVIFKNITFNNCVFENIDFSNVEFINTKFRNCTFIYKFEKFDESKISTLINSIGKGCKVFIDRNVEKGIF